MTWVDASLRRGAALVMRGRCIRAPGGPAPHHFAIRSTGRAAVAIFLLVNCVVASCSDPAGPTPAAMSTQQAPRRQYAVFHDPGLILTRLESPTKVVLAGVASPETLVSSDPDTVSVNADGTVVAHRFGIATIRSIPNPGSSLEVEVRQIKDLRIEPSEFRIRVGTSAEAHLIVNGRPIDAGSADWSSDDLTVVRTDRQILRANARRGRAVVRVRLGDSEAQATVLVEGYETPRMYAPRTLRIGTIGHIDLAPPPLESVEWTTSRPRVLKPIGGGFFEALTEGRVEACARFAARSYCSGIEVTQ